MFTMYLRGYWINDIQRYYLFIHIWHNLNHSLNKFMASSTVENGKQKPTIETLYLFAMIFDMKTSEFFNALDD